MFTVIFAAVFFCCVVFGDNPEKILWWLKKWM